MVSIFVISNVIILIFTIVLQIWGIFCIFIFGKEIRTIDKILFFIPLVIPIKSIKKNIIRINDNKRLDIFLNTVFVYKIFFLINLIICCVFLFIKWFYYNLFLLQIKIDRRFGKIDRKTACFWSKKSFLE